MIIILLRNYNTTPNLVNSRNINYIIFVSIIITLFFISCNFFDSDDEDNDSFGDNWILSIGGDGRDYAPSFCTTSDGYVVVGMTTSYGLGNGGNNLTGSHDFLAVKLDIDGNLIWSTTIGGSQDERGSYSVERTSDDGFLLTGSTFSFGSGAMDIFVVKLNSNGTHAWSKAIGGPGAETGKTTLAVSDGYIVIGETTSAGAGQSDILVVKLNTDGTVNWAKTYGGSGDDKGSGIAQVSDGYILGGTIESYGAGSFDAALIMIDDQGDVQWAKTIGGSGGEGINWDGVRLTENEGIIFGDATTSFGAQGGGAYFGIELDPVGNLIWATFVDGPQTDAGWTMNNADDGFIGGGKYSVTGNGGDVLLVKFDSIGAFEWARTLGSTGLDEIEEVKQIDDSYLFAGVSRLNEPNGDFIFGKINTDGYLGHDPGPIDELSPPYIKPINPQVLPFSPIIKNVTAQINLIDVQPTVTNPIPAIEHIN